MSEAEQTKNLSLEQTGTTLRSGGDEDNAEPVQGAPAAGCPPTIAPLPEIKREDLLKCCHDVKLAMFFDGTNNNLDADIGNRKHSNVARLFRAHPENDPINALFKIYIPGVGTYMKEIGDPGGTLGLAFSRYSQARLDWAKEEISRLLLEDAHYAPSDIRHIRLALFGFSRGATLARVFANKLLADCTPVNGERCLSIKGTKVPLQIYFMGLMDTVASVGRPASFSFGSATQAATDWLTFTLPARRRDGERSSLRRHDEPLSVDGNGLQRIAWGNAPGANPAQATVGDNTNGHEGVVAQYGLAIPAAPFVEKCLHFVAAHEIRNSFPLDSVRQGRSYPPNCTEVLYPGSHSDVGGGYMPGEQGKSSFEDRLLSQVPLLHMHRAAIEAGVPLQAIGSFTNLDVDRDYRISEQLITDFNRYRQLAGPLGGEALGNIVNAQMRHWLHWRFWRCLSSGRQEQLAAVAQQEAQYHQQHDALEKEATKERDSAARQYAETHLNECRQQYERMCNSRSPDDLSAGKTMDALDAAEQDWRNANDPYHKLEARLQSLPKYQGEFARVLKIYDEALLEDAKYLADKRNAPDPATNLRPHYRNVLDRWQAVVRGDMPDPQLAAFFDNYVHDSLAGFATDVTLPSDPRIIFQGGNAKVQFADNTPIPLPGSQQTATGMA